MKPYMALSIGGSDTFWLSAVDGMMATARRYSVDDIAHLRQQQCHNSKSVIFQEKRLEIMKCY